MSVLLWSLLTALAVLGSLLITALVTPLKLDFRLRSSPKWRITIGARLLGGLAPPIQIHDSDRRSQKKEKNRGARDREPKKPGTFHRRGSRMMTSGPGLLQGLLRPIHLDQLTVDADFGLGDPADTGHIYGLLAPLIYSRSPTSVVSISVKPDFAAAHFSGDVLAKLSFIPIALIPPVAKFAWHAFGPRS